MPMLISSLSGRAMSSPNAHLPTNAVSDAKSKADALRKKADGIEARAIELYAEDICEFWSSHEIEVAVSKSSEYAKK